MNAIKELIGHSAVKLVDKGDSAILAALSCAKEKGNCGTVLIPDQAGWLSYPKYPKKLELDVVEVKTSDGKLDLVDLKGKVDDALCLIYQNPAGYFAEQDISKIYDVCKGKCLVVLDITGSIGDKKMANGEYADYTVCSFGRWKLLNMEYGGCVSAKDEGLFADVFDDIGFDTSRLGELNEKIGGLEKRRDFLIAECKKVKENLKDFDIVYPNDESLVVIVCFNDDSEREKIINYCNKNNYEWTVCPRYIRIMKDAISIEVKRGGL